MKTSRFLRPTLRAAGYRLIEAETAAEGVMQAQTHSPDVVLLDLGLPDGDGVEVTRKLRTWTQAPIVVISARGRETGKVEALDAGADDYLIKPFGVNELLARLRVALRHANRVASEAAEPVLQFGDIRLDMAAGVHQPDPLPAGVHGPAAAQARGRSHAPALADHRGGRGLSAARRVITAGPARRSR